MKQIFCALLMGLSGCAIILMPPYTWDATRLEGGSLVSFGCRVDPYSPGWPQEVERKVREFVPRDFRECGEPAEEMIILRTDLSEGGWGGALVVIGSPQFVREWQGKGAYAAGLRFAQESAKNNGPSFGKTYRRKPAVPEGGALRQ